MVVLAAQRAGTTGAEVVVATSDRPEDDVIASTVEDAGILVVRGPLDDPLRRFAIATADLDDDDVVVRLTADNVVPDGELVSLLAAEVTGSAAYTRVGGDDPTLPYGVAGEAFTARALREADQEATDPADREHVTPYVRRVHGGPADRTHRRPRRLGRAAVHGGHLRRLRGAEPGARRDRRPRHLVARAVRTPGDPGRCSPAGRAPEREPPGTGAVRARHGPARPGVRRRQPDRDARRVDGARGPGRRSRGGRQPRRHGPRVRRLRAPHRPRARPGTLRAPAGRHQGAPARRRAGRRSGRLGPRGGARLRPDEPAPARRRLGRRPAAAPRRGLEPARGARRAAAAPRGGTDPVDRGVPVHARRAARPAHGSRGRLRAAALQPARPPLAR